MAPAATRSSMVVPQKLKIGFPYDLAIAFLEVGTQ
jgi:hypothetical protein